MKISGYRSVYEDFSGKLSDIVRSLSFMGFGVVWILIGGLENFKPGCIPLSLMWVLGLLVAYLIMDVFHYIYQTSVWFYYFKKLEKKYGATCEREDFTAPDKYANWGWFFFWLKIVILLAAYLVLLIYIIRLIF